MKTTEITSKALDVTVPVSKFPSTFRIANGNCVLRCPVLAVSIKSFSIFITKYFFGIYNQSKTIFVTFLGFVFFAVCEFLELRIKLSHY